jgi:hypothetical protein
MNALNVFISLPAPFRPPLFSNELSKMQCPMALYRQ